MGPTHCPMPNATVSAAMALVHASGGAVRRANEVTAVIVERNDPPNSSADRQAIGRLPDIKGSAAPRVTAAITAAAPRPPLKRVRTGRQAKTPAIAAQPRNAQKKAISCGVKLEFSRNC